MKPKCIAKVSTSEPVYHIPALLPQVIEALDIKPSGIYVDATYGGGGHSRAIVERLGPQGHLYSFDQDDEAVARAMTDDRFTIVYSNFRFLPNFMRYYGVKGVNGILADLGVSFHHFDDASRGFSFRFDSPLDMRMNRRSSMSAAEFLATATEERIATVLGLYGELKQARRMAAAIVREREAGRPVDTVGRLSDVMKPFISPKHEKKEMAQLFQALRIGNAEGREERDFFGAVSRPLKALSSKPIVPDEAEIERNPRSRSAKLRVAFKLPDNE